MNPESLWKLFNLLIQKQTSLLIVPISIILFINILFTVHIKQKSVSVSVKQRW